MAQTVKHLPTMWETWVQSLGREDFLEKEMATHSSILAWKIPWMEEPGVLQFMGSQRVGHDWANSATHSLTQAWWQYRARIYSFPNFEPVHYSMSVSNCCILTYIQVYWEAGKVVWYSHIFKNFPEFVVVHSQRLSHSQWSKSRCLFGILLLSL